MIKTNEKEFWFCFNKKVDVEKFCKKFYQDTGIKIMAETATDTVHGYVFSFYYDKGYLGECKHGQILDGKKKHTCLQVFLYVENAVPDYKELMDKNDKLISSSGHKTDIKKINLNQKVEDSVVSSLLDELPNVGGVVENKGDGII